MAAQAARWYLYLLLLLRYGRSDGCCGAEIADAARIAQALLNGKKRGE
jgi:hypothetical protein